MLPDPNDSTPTASPSQGHPSRPARASRRGHIACLNCRKRKIKCIAQDEYPRPPCIRCSRKGIKCEYVSVADAPSIPENGPKWLEPLVPESYIQDGSVQSQASYQPFDAYAAEEISDHRHPFRQHPNPTRFPQGSDENSGEDMFICGSQTWQSPPLTNPFYPPLNAPSSPPVEQVHYGPFPGPANTIYPWTRRGPTEDRTVDFGGSSEM
ncbi:hypothetical protein B0H11DRAFT_1353854 [Mycena galericulata]|nr:hypothetical protein B0H11DRAFT_1353854 [Mycena galericulata]